MTRTVLLLMLIEEDRTEILKSGLDLAVQYRNLAKTEVSLLNVHSLQNVGTTCWLSSKYLPPELTFSCLYLVLLLYSVSSVHIGRAESCRWEGGHVPWVVAHRQDRPSAEAIPPGHSWVPGEVKAGGLTVDGSLHWPIGDKNDSWYVSDYYELSSWTCNLSYLKKFSTTITVVLAHHLCNIYTGIQCSNWRAISSILLLAYRCYPCQKNRNYLL